MTYRLVSVGQVGLTAARFAGTATVVVKQINFSHFFFLFLSREVQQNT